MKRSAGFTLLEVLVATAIFAIIGLSASQVLRTVVDTQAATSEGNEVFRESLRAMSQVERDLGQIVMRDVRDEYGEPLPHLMVGVGDYPLEFSRAGWNNPLGFKRSELQRVAYSVEDNTLYRYFWTVMDRAQDAEPIRQALLSGVEAMRVSVLDIEGNALDVWPPFDEGTPPDAIELTLSTFTLGEIRRIFDHPEAPQPVAAFEDPDTADPDHDDRQEDELDDLIQPADPGQEVIEVE